MAVHYVGLAGVAAWFDNATAATVSKWLSRYAETHPCPEPDVEIDGRPGWLPERRAEWEAWRVSRPGQGTGGGPKPSR